MQVPVLEHVNLEPLVEDGIDYNQAIQHNLLFATIGKEKAAMVP